jgi:tetratricopeptide (TPR) repeat protein
MLRLLGRMTALLLCLSATGGAAGAPVDCGPTPNTKCLAAAIFLLAKTLPEKNGFRERVAFAETALADGDLKIALEYVVGETADPPPWEDIEWMARAGRFERAIEQAKQRTSPVERLGGLLAVAGQFLDKNDTVRAQKIIEEVDRELPSVPVADNDPDAGSLGPTAGEIRARLGQLDRAAQLISGTSEAVGTLLAIASKYPAAASLREPAWQEAERAKELRGWQQLIEDAISRGDKAEISGVARRAGKAIGAATDANNPMWAIPLARVLLAAGEPNLSADLLKQWPQWLESKEEIIRSNICKELMPVLAGLGRDQDVEAVVRAENSPADRSQCLSKAAEAYFHLGRHDVAERLDAEALALAESSPTRESKLKWDHDAALHNLALARARRGDIDGALIAAAKLRDEAKVREVTSYVVRSAIDGGFGPITAPAIETLEQRAAAAQDTGLLLQAGGDWHSVGKESEARRSLDQAEKIARERGVPLNPTELGVAVELTWRLNGKSDPQSLVETVDRLGVSDPSTIDHLVEIIMPVSPAVALQLADRQVEVWRRIMELGNIAIRMADDAK